MGKTNILTLLEKTVDLSTPNLFKALLCLDQVLAAKNTKMTKMELALLLHSIYSDIVGELGADVREQWLEVAYMVVGNRVKIIDDDPTP